MPKAIPTSEIYLHKKKGLNRKRLNKKVTFSEVFNLQSRQLINCHKSNGFEPCID